MTDTKYNEIKEHGHHSDVQKDAGIYPQKTLSKFEIYPYICGLIVAH